MRVLPVAILVLLGFAAFFMTFLVAPLLVLTIFYVCYSVKHRSDSKPAEAPAAADPQRPWNAEPEAEGEAEPPAAPVRRGRITVESHSERAAAEELAAAEQAAAREDEQGAEKATASATKTEP